MTKIIKTTNSEECNKLTTYDESLCAATIGISYKRVGVKLSLQEMISSASYIHEMFPTINSEDLIQALKNGASGMYGKTFKMCDQEICMWITKYLKELKQPLFNENGVLSAYAKNN